MMLKLELLGFNSPDILEDFTPISPIAIASWLFSCNGLVSQWLSSIEFSKSD